MNHLQEAKDHVAELHDDGNPQLRDHPPDSEDMAVVGHALIAIASVVDEGLPAMFDVIDEHNGHLRKQNEHLGKIAEQLVIQNNITKHIEGIPANVDFTKEEDK